MPASTSCRGVRVAVAAAVGLLVVGRGGQSATSTTASTPSPSSLARTTAAATTTTAGALTGEELAWLEGLHTRHTKADKVLTDAPSNMTVSDGNARDKDARDGPGDRLAKKMGDAHGTP